MYLKRYVYTLYMFHIWHISIYIIYTCIYIYFHITCWTGYLVVHRLSARRPRIHDFVVSDASRPLKFGDEKGISQVTFLAKKAEFTSKKSELKCYCNFSRWWQGEFFMPCFGQSTVKCGDWPPHLVLFLTQIPMCNIGLLGYSKSHACNEEGKSPPNEDNDGGSKWLMFIWLILS